MAYVTVLDVEAFTGYGAQDMKQGSATMSAEQWEDYCGNDLIPRIEQMVHRYCGVESFIDHVFTEYRSSPGDIDYLDNYMSWMTPGGPGLVTHEAFEFILQQPCIELQSIEIKPNMWIDQWEALTEVGAVRGEYYTISQDEMTHVYINRIPPRGNGNIRITYRAGYSEDHPNFHEIRLIVLRIIRVNMEEKLKFQQAGTIRNVNVRDYVEMYDINKQQPKDIYYIPADVLNELNRYRRLLISQGV